MSAGNWKPCPAISQCAPDSSQFASHLVARHGRVSAAGCWRTTSGRTRPRSRWAWSTCPRSACCRRPTSCHCTARCCRPRTTSSTPTGAAPAHPAGISLCLVMLREADLLSLHCPLPPSTYHMIDAVRCSPAHPAGMFSCYRGRHPVAALPAAAVHLPQHRRRQVLLPAQPASRPMSGAQACRRDLVQHSTCQ